MKKRNMIKKGLACVMAATMTIGLVACGSKAAETPVEAPAETEAEAPAEAAEVAPLADAPAPAAHPSTNNDGGAQQ